MDTNGLAPLAPAYSKPSDAPSALCFVKSFVEDCWGIEFDVGVLQTIVDRRVQKPAPESLQTLGQVLHDFGDQLSSDDTVRVLFILLNVISYPSPPRSKASVPIQDAGSRVKVVDTETLRLAINALTTLLVQSLSTISKDNWLYIVKTMRDVLEMLTNECELVVDWKYSRIYSGLLRCFQLALSDFKASIGDHVAGLVASLASFLGYGWSASHFSLKTDEAFSDAQKKETPTNKAVYKPPHLRRMSAKTWSQKLETSRENQQSKSEVERRALLSDSDQSDSDGAIGNLDRFKCSKTRTLAILNIQALARAEPKSLHAHWTLLFPMYDILNTRRLQNSLLKTLLYDPILKVRVAAAATISLMLEGPSRAFIRMAEFRDIGKTGSFMTLSFSLGQVLLQLQRGLSHLALNETNLGLLVAILKALSLFVGSAPFSRLPNEMLPNIIEAIQKRIKCLLSLSTNDQVNAVCMALNCIGCALNTTPSDQVARMLSEKGSETILESQLLRDLLDCTNAHMPTLVRVEALQALKFAIHNYPCIAMGFWSFISPIKQGILKSSAMPYIGGDPRCEGFHQSDEKVVLAATKLLNESLRIVSGASFTDDAQDDVFHHSLFASQAMHILDMAPTVAGQNAQALDTRMKLLEVTCWHESLRDYLPLLLQHSSALVRAEAMTCFAGLTFSVFCDLAESQRSYIISTVLEVARRDESSVVRSTSCRALGVLVNFPKLTTRTEFLTSAMDLILFSTRDSALVVRITASWALANLCDALRCASEGNNGVSISLSFKALAECAMRLSKDNDKVRANAVRALGNLIRVIKFDSDNTSTLTRLAHDINPHHPEQLHLKASEKYSWLERVVQTLVSCVTTGNVKVQWNVCHALGNLFLNKSILLSDMGWSTSVYSILLLLLRDSKNFKIRIQAASALAVPEMRGDYGESFSDVVQALVLALDASNSSEAFDPSTFKYASALSEQLTTTCLHVLGLTECRDYELLQDFLIKRESFLENWLRLTQVSASQNVADGGCQCIENEGNEGTSSSHLARCWIHKERPPRERIWYALNDRDSQVSNEKTLHKRKESVSRVCEKLIEMYTYGKQMKHAGPFQQLLKQSG
ncbi:hypothetical protein GOP47_0027570 [Adiantum capillus-veneris]|nr:hypothetical protein GOP47_0027570 [Adiantum capillus-veneris]